MFGASVGHGDILIWFFEIFMFVVWFWLLMTVVGDLFRDHTVSGVSKALWVVGPLLFPYIGVLAYLIVRGGGVGARAAQSMRQAQERSTPTSEPSPAPRHRRPSRSRRPSPCSMPVPSTATSSNA